jgi:Putative zinc-finger
MNCRSAESLFSALLEDELNQRERRALETHLLSCRRCSLSLRELRASFELYRDLPWEGDTSPHFEEDVLARIRSGEGLRPTVVEWLRTLWTPGRPFAVAGALAAAIAVTVLAWHPELSSWVAHRTPSRPAIEQARGDRPVDTHSANSVSPAPLLASASDRETVVSAPTVSAPVPTVRREASRSMAGPSGVAPTNGAGLASFVDPAPDAAGSAIPNPDSRYIDEYITDQFYLDRGLGGSGSPSITPVSGRPSDDVYIVF